MGEHSVGGCVFVGGVRKRVRVPFLIGSTHSVIYLFGKFPTYARFGIKGLFHHFFSLDGAIGIHHTLDANACCGFADALA